VWLPSASCRTQSAHGAVPTEDVVEVRGGKKESHRDVYGLVLVKWIWTKNTWTSCGNTRGLHGFAGSGHAPAAASESEVDADHPIACTPRGFRTQRSGLRAKRAGAHVGVVALQRHVEEIDHDHSRLKLRSRFWDAPRRLNSVPRGQRGINTTGCSGGGFIPAAPKTFEVKENATQKDDHIQVAAIAGTGPPAPPGAPRSGPPTASTSWISATQFNAKTQKNRTG